MKIPIFLLFIFNMSLKVTIGVVKRGVKELEMYRKEVVEGEAKLKSLSSEDDTFSQSKLGLFLNII
jgi:hypothetical protein